MCSTLTIRDQIVAYTAYLDTYLRCETILPIFAPHNKGVVDIGVQIGALINPIIHYRQIVHHRYRVLEPYFTKELFEGIARHGRCSLKMIITDDASARLFGFIYAEQARKYFGGFLLAGLNKTVKLIPQLDMVLLDTAVLPQAALRYSNRSLASLYEYSVVPDACFQFSKTGQLRFKDDTIEQLTAGLGYILFDVALAMLVTQGFFLLAKQKSRYPTLFSQYMPELTHAFTPRVIQEY